jgi:indole-3-glycerol phosphate synthase
MKNILDEIVISKKKEIEELKKHADLEWYKSFSADFDRKCISLKQNLLKENSTGIIAEFKRKSPSKGWFKDINYAAPATVMGYEKYGAAGASILTDTPFFGGDLPDITVARVLSGLPLLRKDFMLDEIQIMQAKAYGADVILLIAAILTPQRVQEMAIEAKKYGLEVLLELHEENELGHVCSEVDMIGINNRNLKTFEVDIDNSLRLAKQIPDNFVKIAESGIDKVETIQIFKDNGFKGFLIGETFMKQPDPTIAFAAFVNQLKNVPSYSGG